MQLLRNANGSKSTRNLKQADFRPKRTVSINLYGNNNTYQSPESLMMKQQMIDHSDHSKTMNSSKFSTIKKRNTFGTSHRNSFVQNSIRKNYQNFGNRKQTLEDSPSLANLSKQLEKTEQSLVTMSRKQSQQMIDIHGKIQMLKDQLLQHKGKETKSPSVVSTAKTPNSRGQVKKQNMSKYITSKTRNADSVLKASKTAERVVNRTSHKPFSTLMMNTFYDDQKSKQNTVERKSVKKQLPKYIKKSFTNAMTNLNTSNGGNSQNEILFDSDPSDKTTQRNCQNSSSSQIFNMSNYDEVSHNYATKQFQGCGELMNIQEEQEYTTNEAENIIMDSSCRCDTDEEISQSNKNYLQNY